MTEPRRAAGRHGEVAERAGRFRPRPALEHQITALEQPRPADGPTPEFSSGALAALRWLLAAGPAPLTGTITGQSPPPTAVVRELAAADKLIYQLRSSRREYGRGVQHALMLAQYATATPPSIIHQLSHPQMAEHLREPLHVRLRLHVGPVNVMLAACPVPRGPRRPDPGPDRRCRRATPRSTTGPRSDRPRALDRSRLLQRRIPP